MVSTLPAPPPPSTSITALNNLMRQWKRCCSLALMYRGYLDTHVGDLVSNDHSQLESLQASRHEPLKEVGEEGFLVWLVHLGQGCEER